MHYTNTNNTIGFCLTEVPVTTLLSDSEGNRRRNIKRTHSLFIYSVKIYQAVHKKLMAINEIIVASWFRHVGLL